MVSSSRFSGFNWRENKTARLLAITLVYAALLFTPLPSGLSEAGRRGLLVFAYAASLWIFNAAPVALTAIIAMLMLPALGVLKFSEALSGFGNTTVWLLFGILILSVAIQESHLDKRIALSLLRTARGNSRLIVVMIGVVTLVLTFVLPTSVGRAALMTPICLGLARALKLEPGSNLGKSIFLVFSFTSILASVGVMTGAIVTIYAVNIFSQLFGMKFTYFAWFKFMFPGALISSLVVWTTLMFVFPPEFKTVPGGESYIADQIREQGRLKLSEIKMALILVVLISLWMTEKYTGLNVSFSCLIMAIVAVLPGVGVVEWKKAVSSISWNTIVLLGAVLSIARGLSQTGAFQWISSSIFSGLHSPSPYLVALLIAVLVLLMRLGFPNNFTVIAIVLPVIFTVAHQAKINPVWLGLLTVGVSAFGIFLPSQAMTHLTTYSTGYYQIRDMQKSGSVIAVVCVAMYFALAYFYWPVVGLTASM